MKTDGTSTCRHADVVRPVCVRMALRGVGRGHGSLCLSPELTVREHRMERVVVRPEVALQHRQRLRRERACPEQPLASRVVGTAHLEDQRRCGGGNVAGRHTGTAADPLMAPTQGRCLSRRGAALRKRPVFWSGGRPHGLLQVRALWPCRPTSTLKLAVAILTMAILAMAILAMAILAMAILTMARGPTSTLKLDASGATRMKVVSCCSASSGCSTRSSKRSSKKDLGGRPNSAVELELSWRRGGAPKRRCRPRAAAALLCSRRASRARDRGRLGPQVASSASARMARLTMLQGSRGKMRSQRRRCSAYMECTRGVK